MCEQLDDTDLVTGISRHNITLTQDRGTGYIPVLSGESNGTKSCNTNPNVFPRGMSHLADKCMGE